MPRSRAHTNSKPHQQTAELVSSALLVAALALAGVVGGGFGELGCSILALLIFGAVVVRVASSRELALAPATVPLAVLAAFACVSAVWSESIYASLRQFVVVGGCVGAYLLAADMCRDMRVAAAAVWGLALSALGICLMAVRNYAITAGGGSQFWKALMGAGDHERLFGPFLNPGFFAGFLVIAIPVTLGAYLVTRKSNLAALAGLALVMESLALMLTGTKFGIIAAAAALVVMFALAALTKCLTGPRLKRLVLMGLVLAPLLVLFSGPVTSRISQAESGGSQVHSTQFRIYTWKSTLDMIRHNPWVGVGPGAFQTAYPRYTKAGPTVHAHNGYLQIAAEGGVATLVAFVVALLSVACFSLVGIVREAGVPDTEERVGAGIEWGDLVPAEGWRLMSCAAFAALAGSAVRNLVDSDWYIMGIALPFAVLAGMLVARCGRVAVVVPIRGATRAGVVCVCVVLSVASVSLGLGDYLTPDGFGPSRSYEDELSGYERASEVSPLNPKLHRELAKYLAFEPSERRRATEEIDRAIWLAPKDASNYHTRGMVDMAAGETKAAISAFRQALRFNPNSTQTLYQLSRAYEAIGDKRGLEWAYARLLRIENSDYEKIRGVPEMVDTIYVDAHIYFGERYLVSRDYKRAAGEFEAATRRLESWRSNKQILMVRRASGELTPEVERGLLGELRTSYGHLAEAYQGMGESAKADDSRKRGAEVSLEPPE